MKSFFNSGFTRVILILLVVGVLCTVFGAIEYSDSKKTPLDINAMSDDQIQKGAIVEGDIYYNFGVFETVENKRNGHTESTYYRYVIPVAQESYIGIQVTDQSMISQMDTQTDETYDMMDGKIEDTTTTVHIKGKIVAMDKEDSGYFKDFMSSGGFTDDEIDQYGKLYYIQIRDFDQAGTMFIIGIVALVIAGVLIFVTLKRGKRTAPPAPQNFNQSYDQPLQDPMAQQPQAPQNPEDFNQYFAQQPGMQQPQQPGFAQPQDFEQQPPQGPTNF